VSSVKHWSLVHYLNAYLLLYRCHFLIFQYSKCVNINNFLFEKVLFLNLFTFKTPECNHWLPHSQGKLRLIRELIRGEKEAVFVPLGLTPGTEVVHTVEMCLPKCLKLQESLGWEWGGSDVKGQKTPAGAWLLGSPEPRAAALLPHFRQLPGECSTLPCPPHVFRNLIDTQLLPSKEKFILGCVPEWGLWHYLSPTKTFKGLSST